MERSRITKVALPFVGIKRENRERYGIITFSLAQSSSPLFSLSMYDKNNPNTDNLTFAVDLSQTRSLESAFEYAGFVTSLDVGGLDTSKVESMRRMFYGLSRLSKLNLQQIDTGKVKDMYQMFCGCTALIDLKLGNHDTGNVVSMGWMFSRCTALSMLDLSSFNTGKVENMSFMFDRCTTLKYLNLSGFDLNKVTTINSMFDQCSALKTVIGPISGIKVALNLQYCPLTIDSVMVFINGLAEVASTETITFSMTTYKQLTEEQIAIATSKGWTVVGR